MNDNQVVLRQSWWDLLVWFAPITLILAVIFVVNTTLAPSSQAIAWWVAVLEILVIAGGALLRHRMRVELGEADLVVVNFRRRVFPASQVQAVQTIGGSLFSSFRVQIYDGHRWLTLMALTAAPGQRAKIEAKYHVVGQWWLGHHDTPVRSTP